METLVLHTYLTYLNRILISKDIYADMAHYHFTQTEGVKVASAKASLSAVFLLSY